MSEGQVVSDSTKIVSEIVSEIVSKIVTEEYCETDPSTFLHDKYSG